MVIGCVISDSECGHMEIITLNFKELWRKRILPGPGFDPGTL